VNHEHETTIEDHDRGLAFDLPRLMSRRHAVGLVAGGIGSFALAACGSSEDVAGTTTATPAADSPTTDPAGGGSTTEIPDETAGPYPGDGSNGPNVLSASGVVRRDITKSFGDASGTAGGVPTTVEMKLLDVAAGGTPLAGAAVYIWHCTRDGQYSMYDDAVANENFLRGVQESGRDGTVTFETIFPGAYAGRWPHIHFEVYESLDAATSAGSKLKTSQLALPPKACEQAYATDGYEQSVQNFSQGSLDSDMVFSDGYAGQLATASGSVTDGLTMKLNVGV
jgi:protocatechuate 3,4-dioxygenase beta subunit